MHADPNLTYGVEDVSGQCSVLSRLLAHAVLNAAHGLARELCILVALVDSPVPVPRPLAICQNVAVTGAPFYVMEYVEGAVLRDASRTAVEIAVAAVRRVTTGGEPGRESLIDIDAVSLGFLAKRDVHVMRQRSAEVAQMSLVGALCARTVKAVGSALASGMSTARVPDHHARQLSHRQCRSDEKRRGGGGIGLGTQRLL